MDAKKVWFITGSSSGFGRALSVAALRRGDRVALTARREAPLDELAKQYPEHALALPLDVTDAGQRATALEAVLQRFGRIDVLANIAGRGSLGAAEEFAPAQLREQMELNFFAAAELTRDVLPTFRRQRGGHVLNLTSIGGLASFAGFAAYCASKFALEGWSEALHDEVAPLGIHVTLVEPGAFRTEFAGATNMRAALPLADYLPVIGPIEKYLYGNDGLQPGDPDKAAAAMLAVVDSANPPLHLLLGADAFGLWEKKRAAMEAEFAAWRAVGEATAFDGAAVRPVGG